MAKGPLYAILGRGQWAATVERMLAGEQRKVAQVENTRKEWTESEDQYVGRIADELRAAHAQIAWLCVPPGPHVTCMIEAASKTGLHTIVEKPWTASRAETARLVASARAKKIAIGIDFEYCLLDEVQAWRARFHESAGLRFGGRFHVSRPDRLGLPALDNLGTHLLAIQRYAVPRAAIAELSCAYSSKDERRVWIASDTVDFTHNRQPLLQRFVKQFEAATEVREFDFGLEFAQEVAEALTKYRGRQTAESREL